MKRSVILAVLVAIILAGTWEWEYANFVAPGPAAMHGGETVVLIKPGAGLRAISAQLADAHVLPRPELFELGVWLRGKTAALKAGEYAIPSHASLRDIMNILIAGKSIEHKLTAAEGLTSQMIFDAVKNDPVLVGPPGKVPEEGTLLPETYLFTRGTTRQEIFARMRKAQAKLLAELWPKRPVNIAIKSEREAVILASIVEKETAIPRERTHIAAVFLNRLKLGMKLQSDPTIIYGITKGYPLGRGIRLSELNAPTPYNTYVIDGLTPTPICNPGKNSIAAVLKPDQSGDLYFVADGTGGHVFSATAAEQSKNVANWRKIEKQLNP